MGAGNTAPDDTDLAAVDLTLGTVDVSDTLTQVELSILGGLNTFDLNQRSVLVLVTLGALVAQNTALAVQAALNEFRLVNVKLVGKNVYRGTFFDSGGKCCFH